VIAAIGATIHVTRWSGGLQPTAPRQLFQLPPGADPTFTVRSRRPGDRFQPLGMARQKKLKDFLIDRKVDVELRDRLPLLEWNGEIVWVAGVEVSERFRAGGGDGTLYEVWTD
jgi:tRNA(Ile)-lysidine synthase